jgi:hypothetical protein
MIANTGTSATLAVRLMSWLSPLRYSTELLMRLLLSGKSDMFREEVLNKFGYTYGEQTCFFALALFVGAWLALGFYGLHRLAQP